jgi:hypothetical protein
MKKSPFEPDSQRREASASHGDSDRSFSSRFSKKLAISTARFGLDLTRGGGQRGLGACLLIFAAKWNFSKKHIYFIGLQEEFHHDCVLFVQHLPENGCAKAFRRRSVVACAELFGDVDRATEGGIPRSSR